MESVSVIAVLTSSGADSTRRHFVGSGVGFFILGGGLMLCGGPGVVQDRYSVVCPVWVGSFWGGIFSYVSLVERTHSGHEHRNNYPALRWEKQVSAGIRISFAKKQEYRYDGSGSSYGISLCPEQFYSSLGNVTQ